MVRGRSVFSYQAHICGVTHLVSTTSRATSVAGDTTSKIWIRLFCASRKPLSVVHPVGMGFAISQRQPEGTLILAGVFVRATNFKLVAGVAVDAADVAVLTVSHLLRISAPVSAMTVIIHTATIAFLNIFTAVLLWVAVNEKKANARCPTQKLLSFATNA